jgi:hypothetical protein
VSDPRRTASGSFSTHQQKKKFLMDSLLLALRKSDVARVVDIGTLEYFLDSSYPQMVRGDSIDLTRLWDVLVAEPGIDGTMMYPPLFAYKSWEDKLGVTVFLPPACKELSAEERREYAGRCPIELGDLDRLLAQRKLPPPRVAQRTPSAPRRAIGDKDRATKRRASPLLFVGLVLVVLVTSASIGGYRLLRPSAVALDLAPFAEQIALSDGKQSGSSMSAVIADRRFLSLSPSERTLRATQVFEIAKRLGFRSMLLVDQEGTVRVRAQEVDHADQVSVGP